MYIVGGETEIEERGWDGREGGGRGRGRGGASERERERGVLWRGKAER